MDLSGSISAEELTKYLTEKHGFKMEDDRYKPTVHVVIKMVNNCSS